MARNDDKLMQRLLGFDSRTVMIAEMIRIFRRDRIESTVKIDGFS